MLSLATSIRKTKRKKENNNSEKCLLKKLNRRIESGLKGIIIKRVDLFYLRFLEFFYIFYLSGVEVIVLLVLLG